jgi:hypothetical protein
MMRLKIIAPRQIRRARFYSTPRSPLPKSVASLISDLDIKELHKQLADKDRQLADKDKQIADLEEERAADRIKIEEMSNNLSQGGLGKLAMIIHAGVLGNVVTVYLIYGSINWMLISAACICIVGLLAA